MKTFILLALISVSTPTFAAEELLRLVSVSGEGEVKIKPDVAMVSLQVHTRGKDAKTAQTRNAQEMERVTKLLRSTFKIEEKFMQTSGFYVQPEYNYENNGKQRFKGYTVDHSLSVKVKDLEKLGSLLDEIVGKGTEDVSVLLQGVSFDTDRRQEVEAGAMERAMNHARSKAEALAKFGGRSLKGVFRISDSSVRHQPPVYAAQAKVAAMADMAEGAAAPRTAIAAGEIVVSSQVSVDYEMN